MSKMNDSTLDPKFLAELIRANPPCERPNGIIFTGPVRLSFPNIFRPGKPSQPGAEGKFGAALMFPLGADMSLFQRIWITKAREAFPRNWDGQGNPVGLHSPFHDQREKAFGPKPMPGYTPGAIVFNVSSKFQPQVVDQQMNPITDESRVYPGVWAYAGLNTYKYGPPQPKSGIGFGLQTLMIIADDLKLAGGGAGNPAADFAGVTITAQSNIAARFDGAPQQAPAPASIMPQGGFVGSPGRLPTQALPVDADDFM